MKWPTLPWIQALAYSFPIQLLLLHLRSHLLFLVVWAAPALMIAGLAGRKLGLGLLFLDPEYLGKVSFWSFFFIGFTFAGFVMTWNLTSYLLSAHQFPFLASLAKPFTKFCVNNFIVPVAFLGFYLSSIIRFQDVYEGLPVHATLLHITGLLAGMLVLLVFNGVYFHFTNTDIFAFVRKGLVPADWVKSVVPGRRDANLDYIKQDENCMPVRIYLTETLLYRPVRSVEHYDASMLMRIFRQNHLNALLIQLLSMFMLIGLGSFIEVPWLRIPAGASIFILASLLTALLGAIVYWFSQWWVTALIAGLLLLEFLTGFDTLRAKNKAYGLDYRQRPVLYAYHELEKLCHPDTVALDIAQTILILENWRAKMRRRGLIRPKMVVVCVSGGGLRSAAWTMYSIQRADSLLNGRLMDHATLVTGASGGMIGMAYLRELYLQSRWGAPIDYRDSRYAHRISRDLLNAVAFTTVSNDFFLPWNAFKLEGQRYLKDRGYIFEHQLNENSGRLLDKKLYEYRIPEQQAVIPMMYLTPTIVNDGRRMVISPHGVSFMMTSPIGVHQPDAVEIDAVDFRRLLCRHRPDELRFLTALRMNASYPYVLPTIHLPTTPGIEVMDAGFRDNYGLLSAARFIQVFQKWIQEHTSGVVLVQINTSEKIETISPSEQKGVISSLFNPLDVASQLLSLQEFEQDASIGFVFDLLGTDRFQVIRFLYRPTQHAKVPAAISFHLTRAEKQSLWEAWDLPENQRALQALANALDEKKPFEIPQ